MLPTDTTVTSYNGTVVISDIKRTEDANGKSTYSTETGKTISEDNYFHAIRVDAERLEYLQSKGYNTSKTASNLDNYYVYEVYLKSPGPTPAVGILSIPKNPTSSTGFTMGFAGYSASSPSITTSSSSVYFNVSHSGYWIDASKAELYNKYNSATAYDIPVIKASGNIPTFCNFAGPSIDGRFGRTNVNMGYEGTNHDYFDCAFLASCITADVTIPRCGLGDYTCPPASIIAMYNSLKCNKSISFYQNSTHSYCFSTKDYPEIPEDNYKFTVTEQSQLNAN